MELKWKISLDVVSVVNIISHKAMRCAMSVVGILGCQTITKKERMKMCKRCKHYSYRELVTILYSSKYEHQDLCLWKHHQEEEERIKKWTFERGVYLGTAFERGVYLGTGLVGDELKELNGCNNFEVSDKAIEERSW